MTSSSRENPDWLSEFVRNAEWGEAPQYVYFWVGVAAVATALRRQVWIDQKTFAWYPNLYTLIVAPPGVIAKSTTMDLAFSRMLGKLPDIKKGPSTVTWQALYDAFADVGQEFEYENELHTQYPLYIASSEFGITLNTEDNEMIDQLVHIWDGREMMKRTRKDGELLIPTPSLNMIACTTPEWVARSFGQYLIGGGLTSRMLFVYAHEKVRHIAYPASAVPQDYKERNDRLIRDLERITKLRGNYRLTREAIEWGEAWYEHFHNVEAPKLDRTLLGGYIARKQTLVHKLAMVLSASHSDELVITRATLERAVKLITELEKQMPQVFSRVGATRDSNSADRVLDILRRNGSNMRFELLYRAMHKEFPDVLKFETLLSGMIEAKYIKINPAERTVIAL